MRRAKLEAHFSPCKLTASLPPQYRGEELAVAPKQEDDTRRSNQWIRATRLENTNSRRK
jgi:hypothetical protein